MDIETMYPPETSWPPAPFDSMVEAMAVWRAWWAGDTDALSDIYTSRQLLRPGTHSKKAARQPNSENELFFWGRPNEQGDRRRHVSTPAAVARASAALLFAKHPRINLSERDGKNEELVNRLEKIFGPRAYGGELISAGEVQSALGGVFLRPWWDRDVADHVIPSHVPADRAIPIFRVNRLVGVTFWTTVSEPGDSPVLRHLEVHTVKDGAGRNYHFLFAGTEGELGERIDLREHPATAWAADKVDEDGGFDTYLDSLDVVYVPNVQPNRTWHDSPGLALLGRSDFDGIEGEFDTLDEVYTSWMRDVEDAKSRLFVDESMIEDHGPGRGGSYDPEKRVYTALKTGLGAVTDGGPPITDVKFEIRWNEHAQTMAEIKQHILEHVGISAQHFADGPLSVNATATEVNSRDIMTKTTRASKAAFWERGLAEFVWIVMKLDSIHFSTGLSVRDMPEVHFTTRHVESELDIAQAIQTKVSTGVMSRETGVRTSNPDWTQREIDEELERIAEDERQQTLFATGAFPGGPADPALQQEQQEGAPPEVEGGGE